MFLRVIRVRSLFSVGIFALFILLGAGLTSVFSGEPDRRAYDGSNLVRLRFVANSDAPEDQSVKREVRDFVLERSRAWMTAATDGREMRELIEAHRDDVLEDARRAIAGLGRDDPVRVAWGPLPYEADPDDPVGLPSGSYFTLQVIIGEGAGHNWWCLLFPTLCFGSEKGMEPVLPSSEGVVAGSPEAAGDGSGVTDPGVGVSEPNEPMSKAGARSIRWALAGFAAPAQAAEGAREPEGGSAADRTVGAGALAVDSVSDRARVAPGDVMPPDRVAPGAEYTLRAGLAGAFVEEDREVADVRFHLGSP